MISCYHSIKVLLRLNCLLEVVVLLKAKTNMRVEHKLNVCVQLGFLPILVENMYSYSSVFSHHFRLFSTTVCFPLALLQLTQVNRSTSSPETGLTENHSFKDLNKLNKIALLPSTSSSLFFKLVCKLVFSC